MLSTPILLITFNRPQHTRKVLERILEANPQEFYIFQDGAREGNHTDQTQCEAVRRVVEELITIVITHSICILYMSHITSVAALVLLRPSHGSSLK